MQHLLTLCLLFITTTALADDLVNIKAALQNKYQSINTWQADFVQETYLETLDKVVKKSGKIWAQKPGKLKIDYIDSPQKTYISNGKRLWVYSPDNAEVVVFKKMSQLVASEALDFLNGLGELDKQFEVMLYSKSEASEALIKSKTLNLLELVPRAVDSVLDRIVLAVDPKSQEIIEMTLFNESGNKAHYVFSNRAFNTSLDKSFFEFVKPKGVKEVNR